MTSTRGAPEPPVSRQATGPPVRAVALALPVIVLPLVLTAVGPWSSATGVAGHRSHRPVVSRGRRSGS